MPEMATLGRLRYTDRIFSGSSAKKPPKPMPVSIWMWASTTVERSSAAALRAIPVSDEPTVHTTSSSMSCASSSRSTVGRSMSSSSSTKPALRRAAGEAADALLPEHPGQLHQPGPVAVAGEHRVDHRLPRPLLDDADVVPQGFPLNDQRFHGPSAFLCVFPSL